MAPKKHQKSSLSRLQVICGKCSKVLERYESLKPHFDTFHDRQPPYEKGQTQFSLGLSPSSRKRTVSENENLFSSASEEHSHPDTHDISSNAAVVTPSPAGSPPLFRPSSVSGQAERLSDVIVDESSKSNKNLIEGIRTRLDQLELNVCSSSSHNQSASPPPLARNSSMPPPPTSEASPLISPTTSKSVASQDPIEKGEHNF